MRMKIGRSMSRSRVKVASILVTAVAALMATLADGSSGRGAEGANPSSARAAHTLENAAPSLDGLIARFVQALRDNDREALHGLRLTESEYRNIVVPGHVPVGEPLRNYPPDVTKIAWDLLNTKSSYYETFLLNEFGGGEYEIEGVEWERGTERYATYAAYKQLRLKLQKSDSIVELRTGSVAEIDGQFKFVSYIRD
jgi:hypothetical protein